MEKQPPKPIRTVKDAEIAVKNVSIKKMVQTQARIKGLNLAKLSAMMGMSKSYLSIHFDSREVNISFLIAASHHLDLNLIEPYLNLLAEQIVPTAREKNLEKQMEELKKQLEEKERHIAMFEQVLSFARK